MEQTTINSKIKNISDEIMRLTSTLRAMDNIRPENCPDNYELLSIDAALRSEQIACKLRHLIYSTTVIKKDVYLTSAAVMHGTEIMDSDGIFEIVLPVLLPKRKQRRSAEFITDPLYSMLSQYTDTHVMRRYSNCVVCFVHVYRRDAAIRRIRDYDNIELKQILDIIAAFFMEDDNGMLCDAYNTTELGDTDCTRISVMDKNRFYNWIKERENRLKSISDF